MIDGWTAIQNLGVLRASMAADSYSKNRAAVTTKAARAEPGSRRRELGLRTRMTVDGAGAHRFGGKCRHEDVLARDHVCTLESRVGLILETASLPASRVEREQGER